MAKTKKINTWSGPNKGWVRNAKITTIQRAQREGQVSDSPMVLSLPGATAHLEQTLIQRKIAESCNMIGVQTYERIGGHVGDGYLRKLIKLRDKNMPDMFVWPYNLDSFTKAYKGDTVSVPNYAGSFKSRPKWCRTPTFRTEMESFIDLPATPFDILDIDICGAFKEKTAGLISRLMENEKLAESGLFFFTHQKGRDGGNGNLFPFVRKYFSECQYIDVEDCGTWINLDEESSEGFHFIRYVLVPLYFMCEGFKYGYKIEIDKLLEYRDINAESSRGNFMLQWFFRFENIGDSLGDEDFYEYELEQLKEAMDDVLEERYFYSVLGS